jgi:putative transposase
MASPAAREPGPVVTLVLKRTVAKVLSIVISSSLGGVFDVRHAGLRSLILLAGRGYLQSSRRQSLRGDDASCTSHLLCFVA